MKKKVISFICLMVLLISITGCINSIRIPNIENTDEVTAKNILSSNGIIPVVRYENSDIVEEGYVIRTEPNIGISVEKNSQVTIVVSRGPEVVASKDSRIEWLNIGSGDDKWEFYNPYIEDNMLKIECHNVVFASKMEWVDEANEGLILGTASINDTYDKTVPVKANYIKKSFNANEAQSFTLEVPINDLNVNKPTNMYIRLFANINGRFTYVNINFTMTW